MQVPDMPLPLPLPAPCRCLTCDREIKSQGLGPTTNIAKGTFLPKLDPLPAKHPVHPMGPGLNPGELKRMADDMRSSR